MSTTKMIGPLSLAAILPLAVSCSAGGPSFDVLVLDGRVEVVGIDLDGKPLDGRFTLALASDGRFHETIALRGRDRVDQLVFDGERLLAWSFLAYPRTPFLEANAAEAALWRSVMDALRTSTEPQILAFSAEVPVDERGSPVGTGVAAVTSAITAIEIVIEEVDAQGHRPVPTAWVRILGGTRNVPYRSRGTGGEARQVLAFTVHTVRFENDLPELPSTRARNR
ncbi:MAG: hypothetical protein O7F70_04340 [Gemmatimonadetes bacterium]|nr:hypothetical protein [Gemmatimonadota bacterium]